LAQPLLQILDGDAAGEVQQSHRGNINTQLRLSGPSTPDFLPCSGYHCDQAPGFRM